MIKFLKKCTFAFIIFIGIIAFSFFFLFLFSPGLKKVFESSRFKNKNYELLVFGNSMALDCIDAEYLSINGIRSYNFAIAGSHISTAVLQLEEYLKYNKKPKKIILGLSSATGISLLNKVPHKNPEIEFFYHPSFYSSILNPPPVNLRWLFVEVIKIIVSKDHRNSEIINGQWKSPKIIPDNSIYKRRNTKLIDYRDPYLYKLVQICHRKGIEIVLIELPGSNENRNEFPFRDSVKLTNGRLHLLYNFNNIYISSKIINDQKDWLAPNHLNKYGGRKITMFLYNEIINLN